MEKTDAVVIGAGPGGYVAAIRLAQLGKRVTLIERDKVGGECLNYGCIPSKALITAGNLFSKMKNASEIGIRLEVLGIDMERLHRWKRSVIEKLSSGIVALCKNYGIEIVHGEARVFSVEEVHVSNAAGGTKIATKNIIISSGSRPLSVKGLETDGVSIITSKEAVDLQSIPKSLLVVGGGAIGLELGTMYAKLGSKVTVVEMMQSILPGLDSDLVRVVSRSLERMGVEIIPNSRVEGSKKGGDGILLSMRKGDEWIERSAEKVLVGVGRGANTEGLGLESIGMGLSERGFIKVDERMMTNLDGVYAIGDVTGSPFLAHKASTQGIVAAENIAGIERTFVPENIPYAIFTHPEVATVGLSEDEARAKGHEISVGKFQFGANGRALTAMESEGLVKVIIDRGSRIVLGVHIVGPEASNLLSEASLAVKMRARIEDIEATVHPHPTLSEAIAEAAGASLGRSIHSIVKRSL